LVLTRYIWSQPPYNVTINSMQKVSSVLLSALILLSFAGCGDSTQVEDGPDGYELLFTQGNLSDIEIVITQEEWDGLINDMLEYTKSGDRVSGGLTGNYRKANFIYTGPAGDTTIDQVGFRTKGHWTRPVPEDTNGDFHKAHFKVKFNEVFDEQEYTAAYKERNNRRFYGLRELEFRMNRSGTYWDESQIRELYCYDLFNRAGAYTSNTGSTKLTITIDGTKHYFGIYTLIEPVDRSFLIRRYGNAESYGDLYKCLWGDSGPATLQPADELIFPNSDYGDERIIGIKDWQSHYRPTYDLKTNKEVADYTKLLSFIDNINNLSGEELKHYLDTHFEIDRFLRYQAMNMLVGKWDDYWAMGNNYYLYFNNSGKIEFITSDYDLALGGGYQLFDTSSVGIYEWGHHSKQFLQDQFPSIPQFWLDAVFNCYHAPLVEKIFEIDEYRATYEGYLKEFITPANKLFVYSAYGKRYEMLYSLYSPYLDNEVDEGEVMINDDKTREYFYNKTKSIIDQLGLNEADYELPLAR